MSKTLSLQELKASGATDEVLTEAATGMPLWRPDDIEAHKRVFEATHKPSVWTSIKQVFGFVPSTVFHYLTAVHLHDDLFDDESDTTPEKLTWRQRVKLLWRMHRESARQTWRTNTLTIRAERATYMRDNTQHTVPHAVFEKARMIDEFVPHAELCVTFFGTDPILEVWVRRRERFERHYALVWDELPDGTICIVPPPHTM
jgi:hypothetical protein